MYVALLQPVEIVDINEHKGSHPLFPVVLPYIPLTMPATSEAAYDPQAKL